MPGTSWASTSTTWRDPCRRAGRPAGRAPALCACSQGRPARMRVARPCTPAVPVLPDSTPEPLLPATGQPCGRSGAASGGATCPAQPPGFGLARHEAGGSGVGRNVLLGCGHTPGGRCACRRLEGARPREAGLVCGGRGWDAGWGCVLRPAGPGHTTSDAPTPDTGQHCQTASSSAQLLQGPSAAL